jgi:hypothetical protein
VKPSDAKPSDLRASDVGPSPGKPGDANGAGTPAAPTKNPPDESARQEQDVTTRGLRPGMVKVIIGTRRYHSPDCPLIQGIDDGGIEIMSRAEARAAGLTNCSVCQTDTQTVS